MPAFAQQDHSVRGKGSSFPILWRFSFSILILDPGIEDDVIRVVGKKSNHISLLEMLTGQIGIIVPEECSESGSVNAH